MESCASAAPFLAGNFLGPRVPFRVRAPVHISVALEGQKQGLQTTVAVEVLGGDVRVASFAGPLQSVDEATVRVHVLCLDPLRPRRLANLALPISLWLDDGQLLPARRLALGKASRRAATKLPLLAFALLRLL
jgi:hypothetical protein